MQLHAFVKAMGKPSRRCRHRLTSIRERYRRRFLEQALLIIVLEEHELDGIGSKFGSRNIQRTRKDVEDMFLELGHHCRKAYRMTPEAFVSLHAMLEAKLRDAKDKASSSARSTENAFSIGWYRAHSLRAADTFVAGEDIAHVSR